MCSIKITLTGFRVRCYVQWWKQCSLDSNHIIKTHKRNTTNRLMPGYKANLYSQLVYFTWNCDYKSFIPRLLTCYVWNLWDPPKHS